MIAITPSSIPRKLSICLFTCSLFAGMSCSRSTPVQPDQKFTGVYTYNNWEIKLNDESGTAYFTKAASPIHAVGDEYAKVYRRIAYNSWSVQVYDRDLMTKGLGKMTMENGYMTVMLNDGNSYTIAR